MNLSKISVVTPVYNGEGFIEETILSVLENSKGFPVDYHIINDGSSDQTGEILEKYSHLVRITTTLNQGESSAVNLGIHSALGEVILILSADDPLFTPEIFDGVLDAFRADPTLVVLYSDWQVINELNQIVELKKPGTYSDLELIGKFHCLPGPGTFFRRSAAIEVGGRSSEWRFVGDYDFWLKLSRVGKFGYRNQTLAQWRQHESSTSINLRGKEMAMERIGVIESFLSQNTVDKKISRIALGSCYTYAAQLCYFSEEVPGKKYLALAFIKARAWPPVASIKVVAFVLGMPFSRWAVKILRRNV